MDSASPADPGLDRPAAGNIPEFSVAELSGALKRTVEGAFGRVRVRGEIVECKSYGPNRFYFSLKDREGAAKVAGVVWTWTPGRSGVRPENGIEVVATGKLTTYADRSSYQLVVERLDWAGEGALLARIEATRQRLLAEGLFAAERKRPLPLLPALVGVITSERGAVLHDIVTTLARRFPRPVLLWPVPVQGPDAAERIAAAIAGMGALPLSGTGGVPSAGTGDGSAVGALNGPPAGTGDVPPSDLGDAGPGGTGHVAPGRSGKTPPGGTEGVALVAASSRGRVGVWRPDVLIVARGGGSLEDLMAFNDEAVVRAAAACPIPLISAVGHETDTTLIDFAADVRAPTPTAAAERAVPARAELFDLLSQTGSRLFHCARAVVRERRLGLVRIERGLPDLPAMLQTARRQLDDRHERLGRSSEAVFGRRRLAIGRAGAGLRHPREAIAAGRARLALAAAATLAATRRALAGQAARLGAARLSAAPVAASLRADAARLGSLGARLEAVSYGAVLARGFALVTAAGAPVTTASAVAGGDRLTLTFADGEVAATAQGRAGSAQPPSLLGRRPRRPPRETLAQDALL